MARTNTTERSKTKVGQNELERVLRAIAFMNPQIGYCQGMNFMVSIILEITGNNEHITFLIFQYFLMSKRHKVESVFMQGLPELSLMNYNFERFI